MTSATRENTPAPACSSELPAVLADIWQRLAFGITSAKAPCHLLTVATIGNDGHPDQRVMVLRDSDGDTGVLRFHTDLRSPKAVQISEHNCINILHYDAVAKVQLRLSGTGRIETQGAIADAAWLASGPSSRRCYMGAAPSSESDQPTSGLAPLLEGRVPSLDETEVGRANFAALLVQLDEIEWLYLAHNGHRRARFTRDLDNRWSGHWLTP